MVQGGILDPIHGGGGPEGGNPIINKNNYVDIINITLPGGGCDMSPHGGPEVGGACCHGGAGGGVVPVLPIYIYN